MSCVFFAFSFHSSLRSLSIGEGTTTASSSVVRRAEGVVPGYAGLLPLASVCYHIRMRVFFAFSGVGDHANWDLAQCPFIPEDCELTDRPLPMVSVPWDDSVVSNR